jgi:hypothetical protein
MREEQHQFLRLLGQLPARLTAERAAWVINCQSHDIPILVAARLLKPLGNPAAKGINFYVASELLELVKDRAWLIGGTILKRDGYRCTLAQQKWNLVANNI